MALAKTKTDEIIDEIANEKTHERMSEEEDFAVIQNVMRGLRALSVMRDLGMAAIPSRMLDLWWREVYWQKRAESCAPALVVLQCSEKHYIRRDHVNLCERILLQQTTPLDDCPHTLRVYTYAADGGNSLTIESLVGGPRS